MPDLFELSAALKLDLSAFEREVARAGSLAAGLEQQLARLTTSAASAMAGVRQATTMPVMNGGTAENGAGVHSSAGDVSDALARAMSGLSVQMDGQAVGRIVADTVDEQIGRVARERRYTG